MIAAEERNDTEEPVKLVIKDDQLAMIRKRAEEAGRTVAELIHEALEKTYGGEKS